MRQPVLKSLSDKPLPSLQSPLLSRARHGSGDVSECSQGPETPASPVTTHKPSCSLVAFRAILSQSSLPILFTNSPSPSITRPLPKYKQNPTMTPNDSKFSFWWQCREDWLLPHNHHQKEKKKFIQLLGITFSDVISKRLR